MRIRCKPEIRGYTLPVKGDAVLVSEAKIKHKKRLLTLMIILLFPSLLLAKREHPEKWYQQKWCKENNGRVEVALPDGTRCDCVTDTHAIEFDFGNNWAEAIGQSAYYSLQSEKKRGLSPFFFAYR
jgi:hypothetical protein